MTKAEAVDLVLLAVLGGKLSHDANVKRAEVSVYMDTAIASAIKMGVFESMAAERSISSSSAVLATYGVVAPIYSSLSATPYFNPKTNRFEVALPKMIALDNDWAIGAVYPEKGDVPFYRQRNPFTMAGAERFLGQSTFYAIEGPSDGAVLIFKNIMQPVCPVRILLAKSVDALADDEEITYPGDMLNKAIEIAIAHFMKQRHEPADITSNNKDINEIPNR